MNLLNIRLDLTEPTKHANIWEIFSKISGKVPENTEKNAKEKSKKMPEKIS